MIDISRSTPGKHNAQARALYYVGIDGGGTHCRANIYDSSQTLLGSGRGGPANPVNGLLLTQQSILCAIREAMRDAKLPDIAFNQLVVGAGLAGLHLPSMQEVMKDWQHPFHALFLTTDLHVATIGAHQGVDGAVIILGTGFSALGLVGGRQFPIGGFGFPIYTHGSGSWFGLEVIKAVLLDADGIGQATSMTQAVFQDHTVLSLAEKLNNAPAQEFARYAPLVFKHAIQGDEVAKKLIEQGVVFVNSVMQKLLQTGSPCIAFVGGISAHIQAYLDSQYTAYIVEPIASPEEGAMYFALQSYACEIHEKGNENEHK
jgi:glucosamine kinase